MKMKCQNLLLVLLAILNRNAHARVRRKCKLNLNEDRLKIVNSRNNLLVMGGPGSGKTTIALLKANNDCKKLKPNQYILF